MARLRRRGGRHRDAGPSRPSRARRGAGKSAGVRVVCIAADARLCGIRGPRTGDRWQRPAAHSIEAAGRRSRRPLPGHADPSPIYRSRPGAAGHGAPAVRLDATLEAVLGVAGAVERLRVLRSAGGQRCRFASAPRAGHRLALPRCPAVGPRGVGSRDARRRSARPGAGARGVGSGRREPPGASGDAPATPSGRCRRQSIPGPLVRLVFGGSPRGGRRRVESERRHGRRSSGG